MLHKKIAIICTINNQRDHTLRFTEFLTGVDGCGLFLFLDNPDHMQYFTDVKKPDNLFITACTDGYWNGVLGHIPVDMPQKQHTNLRHGTQLARETDYLWAMSVDSDELIYNLKELVNDVETLGNDYDMLRLKPAELIHTYTTAYSKETFQGIYFKVLQQWPELTKKLERLDPALRKRLEKMKPFTRRLFFGHINGKTLFRLSAPITTYKQHKQFSDERELTLAILPDKYRLLHFDAMNYYSWIFKWHRRIRGETRATAISTARQKQTKIIARHLGLFRSFSRRRLFNSWYVYNDQELCQLLDVGLVERFIINQVR